MQIELGILVHGENHFIVAGPCPSPEQAEALLLHWTLIRIGAVTPPDLIAWTIRTREFREDLTWAVVADSDQPVNPAVADLLDQIARRGVIARNDQKRIDGR